LRAIVIFLSALIGVYLIDQGIKDIFLAGYDWQSKCISLELHLNKGVAFSMLAFLGDNLKWLQLALIGVLAYLAIGEGWLKSYPLSLGLVAGGAVGNLYDRFFNGAVTDYVYWHCGFDFAVFNFADVAIDVGIGLILLQEFISWRKSKNRDI
jgi:signal peptidase II